MLLVIRHDGWRESRQFHKGRRMREQSAQVTSGSLQEIIDRSGGGRMRGEMRGSKQLEGQSERREERKRKRKWEEAELRG